MAERSFTRRLMPVTFDGMTPYGRKTFRCWYRTWRNLGRDPDEARRIVFCMIGAARSGRYLFSEA